MRKVNFGCRRLEWEHSPMRGGAKAIAHASERLPPGERNEVVVKLLRRAAASPCESPSNDGLLRAANDVFLELDRLES